MWGGGAFIFMLALSSLPSFFVGDEGHVCFGACLIDELFGSRRTRFFLWCYGSSWWWFYEVIFVAVCCCDTFSLNTSRWFGTQFAQPPVFFFSFWQYEYAIILLVFPSKQNKCPIFCCCCCCHLGRVNTDALIELTLATQVPVLTAIDILFVALFERTRI